MSSCSMATFLLNVVECPAVSGEKQDSFEHESKSSSFVVTKYLWRL